MALIISERIEVIQCFAHIVGGIFIATFLLVHHVVRYMQQQHFTYYFLISPYNKHI